MSLKERLARSNQLRKKYAIRYDEFDGEIFIDLYLLASEYLTSPEELVATAGYNRTDVKRESDDDVQASLQTVVDIVDAFEASLDLPDDVIESSMIAYAYYRGWPLVGLGNRTAAELVREGYAEAVAEHITRVRVVPLHD